MSFWLIKFNGFLGEPPPKPPNPPEADCVAPPESGTPSTTINGSLPDRTEVLPRTRIETPAPGSPLAEVICTPATLPRSTCAGESAEIKSKVSEPIASTAPVASRLTMVPYPVTTISSNSFPAASTTAIGPSPSTATSCEESPT